MSLPRNDGISTEAILIRKGIKMVLNLTFSPGTYYRFVAVVEGPDVIEGKILVKSRR